MVFEFELPDVGEGIAEGEIVQWHVEPGDRVEEDQVMADVETDKAVVDLPAPVTGTVRELHAKEGEIVPVGSVVATIEVEGETPEEVAADVTDESEADVITASTGNGRVFAPPSVRRLARELGIDITEIEGTGPSGRITESDVRAVADSTTETTSPDDTAGATSPDDVDGTAPSESPAETVTAETAAEATEGAGKIRKGTADRDRTLATPATRGVARELDVDIDGIPTDKTHDGEAFVEEEDVRAFAEAGEAGGELVTAEPTAVETATEGRVTTEPYKGIRRTIGQRMEQSAFTAPHATHHDTADVSQLVETRENLKARAEKQDVKLTYMPFVLKAIVAALEEFPQLNSELDEDNEEVIYKHYYNIGIAVATDAGLMVPVVENVDGKGMVQIASEVNELASKARERKISPEEMQGGTFTITNFGAFGGEYATPIINYPETAILGLGSIEQRPVVEDGEVVARHTLPLSLAIDHRVIDGAEAAQFVNTVIEYLENPSLFLLE